MKGGAHLTRLVAEREFTEQLRSNMFRAVTVILIVAVASIVLIPAAIGDAAETKTVGIVGGAPPGVQNAALLAGKVAGIDTVLVQSLPSVEFAKRALVEGAVDVVIVNGQSILLKQEPTQGVETSGTDLAAALSQLIGLNRALGAMPIADRDEVVESLKLPIRGVESSGSDLPSRVAGMAAALVIYMFILINGMKITQGVAEEKSTRVVEVVLSAVRPLQLLTGKVVGIGAAAGLQLLVMLITFVACALIAGTGLVDGDAGQVVLAGAIWLVLGYALYCTLFAAAGALISRQSDASSVSTPLLLPLVIVFSLSVSVLFGESGQFFEFLAYFPLTAPIAMPTLYATGAASVSEFMLSMAITIATTVVAFRVAAVIFERSILRTGARVKLGQILRADAG